MLIRYEKLKEGYMTNYLFKEKRYFILYLIFLIFDGINVALMAYFLKYSLDITSTGKYSSLNKACIIVFLYLLFYSLISWCTRNIKASYITKTMYFLKKDLFDSLMKYDIRQFYKTNNSDYISIFNNDLNMLEANYFDSLFKIIRNVVVLIISCIMLIYIHPVVAFVGILLSCLPFLVTKIFGNKLSESTKDYSESLKKYNFILKDDFAGFEIIKSFLMERNIISIHDKVNSEVENSKKKSYYVKANADVATNFIAIGTQFAVYLVSGYFVIQGSITAGGVIAITQVMYKVVNPVFDIIQCANNMKSIEIIKNKIGEILEYEPKERSDKNITKINKEVKFDKVSFKYENSDFQMKNISLKLERGKKYAIVGESGSGKSTLVKLLQGYYSTYSGKISLDHIELSNLNSDNLYQLFSVMHQNVFLFDDSILNNITLHNNYDLEKIMKIVKEVGLESFISNLKDNVYSKIEGNGNNLSGGEKQRIALARALAKGNDWIIMDEATSNLDNETFGMIENLISNLKDITCITITHRYNREILEKYDKIFVLKNGELYEEGTFSELMDKKKLFYSLYTVFD